MRDLETSGSPGASWREERDPTYDLRGVLFVAESLSVVFSRLSERRQITASELADGVLELAAERFGVLGDTVLECWGLHTSEDIGYIVHALVARGLVSLSKEDRIDDFEDLFRVGEDYVARYRIWEGLRARAASGGRR